MWIRHTAEGSSPRITARLPGVNEESTRSSAALAVQSIPAYVEVLWVVGGMDMDPRVVVSNSSMFQLIKLSLLGKIDPTDNSFE